MTKCILNIFFFFNVLLTSAQTQNFKPILDSLKVGETYSKKGSTFKTKVIYLGTVLSSKSDTLFYVLTENYEVKAAIEWHGHSRIVFLEKNKKIKGFYSLDSPEQLPIKLVSNSLFFRDNKTGKATKQKIPSKLPDMLCIPECFSKEN